MRCDDENRRFDEAVAAVGGDGRAVADAIRARARQLGGPLGAAWAGDEALTAPAGADTHVHADTPTRDDGHSDDRPEAGAGTTSAAGGADRPDAVVHYERLADAARSSGAGRRPTAARRTVARLATARARARGLGHLAV